MTLLLVLLLAASSLVGRPDTLKKDSVDVIFYGGKRVIYNAAENRVYLLDSAWVHYQDMRLNADSIVYDIKKHLLSSYNGSYFRTASDSVAGSELHYNVDLHKGYMTLANTELNQAFFSGRDLWLVRDKTMDVNDGVYTTCDRPNPHYHFWGKRVRVYLDDMVIAEPLVMYVGKVPVIAAPFWYFPISSHRKSGLMPFKIGHSSDEGLYAKNISWFWAINEYSDATFVLDVMTRKGFRWSAEGEYVVGPYASGSFLGSYIEETDTKHRRYSISANHGSRFLFGSRIDGRADFQSDASYGSDYSETPELWLKQEFDSYLNLTRSFPNVGSFNLTARRYVDVSARRTQTELPSLGLNLFSLPLFKGWTLSSALTASNTEQTQDFLNLDSSVSVTLIQRRRSVSPNLSLSLPPSLLGGLTLPLSGGYSEDRSIRRDSTGDSTLSVNRWANAGTGLGFSQTLLGFLALSEGVGYSQTMNFYPESTLTSANYNLGLGSHFSLYRIFDVEGLGLHGMLHKATPNLSYGYSPQTRSKGYYGVPRFDTMPAASHLGLNLANEFQVKVGETKAKRNLGNLNLSSSYDFLADSHKFSAISANADLFLLDLTQARLGVSGATTFDPYTRKFSGYSLTSRLSAGVTIRDSVNHSDRDFSISLLHYLSKNDNMLSAQLKLEPKGWSFHLSGGLNFKDKQHTLTDYKLDLVKDLHCWELVASVNRLGQRWSYDFKLRIKQIPDVSVSKGLFSWALPTPLK
jgi:hypothetical protein